MRHPRSAARRCGNRPTFMIERDTVQKILDAADIVDVVSDFVSLKRSGSNFKGLCPFHNEKTPSFIVSPARNICKCFSCGKGGSPVNFIMEHEQMTYPEALRYLAAKYHIEVVEKEMNDEERKAQTDREAMLNINEEACRYFQDTLFGTDDGRDIGLAYFYERGFNDATIRHFQLGYSLDQNDALYQHLKSCGFSDTHIFATGLCSESRHGGGYDRFKGRVMFPVFNVAGKVIAFGGRTLKHDPAKYVNSPESTIYKKSNELYGLFQAKRAIISGDKCFLVEGYTDVIQMAQSGIENVVASSGTSLTDGQIRLVHRFTKNITVLYDGDSAGIKASLRGIDMLLAQGLNIKVLLLPDGEDPDSYAKTHSASEFAAFIAANETDFIKFKTRILLEGLENDPIKRSSVIQDIVRSIAVIPDEITQNVYAQECSRLLDIDEKVLLRQIGKQVGENRRKAHEERERKQREQLKSEYPDPPATDGTEAAPATDLVEPLDSGTKSREEYLYPYEREVARYLLRYGMLAFCLAEDMTTELTLAQYVESELAYDGITFSNEVFDKIFRSSLGMLGAFAQELEQKRAEAEEHRRQLLDEGFRAIAASNLTDIAAIEKKEAKLRQEVDERIEAEIREWRRDYVERRLVNDADDALRTTACDLATDKHQLSKIHTRFSSLESEWQRLDRTVPLAIDDWKNALVDIQIKELTAQLAAATDPAQISRIVTEIAERHQIKSQLAAALGDRVVNPRN